MTSQLTSVNATEGKGDNMTNEHFENRNVYDGILQLVQINNKNNERIDKISIHPFNSFISFIHFIIYLYRVSIQRIA